MNNEDIMLRDLLLSCASSASPDVIDDDPTVFSMQDSTTMMKRKFGDDWPWNAEISEKIQSMVDDMMPAFLEHCNSVPIDNKFTHLDEVTLIIED
jgi:hypothetical protein